MGLNLVTDLDKQGVLAKYGVQVLGTGIKAIRLGEDRQLFAAKMREIGQPVLPGKAATSTREAVNWVRQIGLPVMLRSAYTLGGTGSSLVAKETELERKIEASLRASPIGQVLVEKSVKGWGEIEYEVIRDAKGNTLTVCSMENINPMGIHTGDSIVVAPSQTLSDQDHQKLRTAAIKIVEALNIKGACNVQFAFDYKSGEYYVIEVNPRLSRSSALASKATGYPIAKVATKIALGFDLPEISNDITGKTAFFEPSLDYVVVKIPRWPFDKFPGLNREIGISMKSTGEVMAIGRTFEEALQKGIDSLDSKEDADKRKEKLTVQEAKQKLGRWTDDQLRWILAALRGGVAVKLIARLTGINPWFLNKMRRLVSGATVVLNKRVYKMVDTCSGEFPALTPYFYSTTKGEENEAVSLEGKKAIILGSGPIRIGQGIEFDYMTVHAVKALQEEVKAVIINNNPETVSTDYAMADRLYFEPLTGDYVLEVINNEKKGLLGVICQFGGQTALNLADDLDEFGVKILGTAAGVIRKAEDRSICSRELTKMGLTVPPWTFARDRQEVVEKCLELGFPVLIRPSYVLAGEGMVLVRNREDVEEYLESVPAKVFGHPVLIDRFIDTGIEVDIDLVSDGRDTRAWVMEQVEPPGVHSGDSTCIYPARRLSRRLVKRLEEIAGRIAERFAIVGMGNVQAVIRDNEVYIVEINPRASRTIPFLSKAIGVPLVKIATGVILGQRLDKMGRWLKSVQGDGMVAMKQPVFSFDKLPGLSTELGPVMKSTGEVMVRVRSDMIAI